MPDDTRPDDAQQPHRIVFQHGRARVSVWGKDYADATRRYEEMRAGLDRIDAKARELEEARNAR